MMQHICDIVYVFQKCCDNSARLVFSKSVDVQRRIVKIHETISNYFFPLYTVPFNKLATFIKHN